MVTTVVALLMMMMISMMVMMTMMMRMSMMTANRYEDAIPEFQLSLKYDPTNLLTRAYLEACEQFAENRRLFGRYYTKVVKGPLRARKRKKDRKKEKRKKKKKKRE